MESVMPSNEDEYNSIQEPIEVKEEKIEIDDDGQSGSTCADKQGNLNKFIKTINYDEIVSSIEIVKQLQKALKDANQRESEEECIKDEREIIEENESKPCSSICTESQANTDVFIKTLSNKEIVSSKEIVKPLKQALTDSIQRENEEECIKNEKEIKQEKESEGILSQPSEGLDNMESDLQEKLHNTRSSLEKAVYSSRSARKAREMDGDDTVREEGNASVDFTTSDFEEHAVVEVSNVEERQSQQGCEIQPKPSKLRHKQPVEKTLTVTLPHMPITETDLTNQQGICNRDMSIRDDQDCASGGKCSVFSCIDCGQKFTRKSSLVRHSQSQSHVRQCGLDVNERFQCNTCEGVFGTKAGYEDHFAFCSSSKQHKSSYSTEFPCETCGKILLTKTRLRMHVRRHKMASLRPHQCTQCNQRFIESSHLKVHLQRHLGYRPYACSKCDKRFTTQHDLRVHEAIHLDVKEFICNDCGVSFKVKGNLINHIKTLHIGVQKLFVCDVCGKRFARNPELRSHQKVHSENKDHVCTLCGSTFKFPSNLRNHIQTKHSSEKLFLCSLCDQKFSTKYRLKLHQDSHSNERPFECNQCNKTFKRRKALSVHMQVHMGLKPYRCEVCLKTFNYKAVRDSHLKIHLKNVATKFIRCKLRLVN